VGGGGVKVCAGVGDVGGGGEGVGVDVGGGATVGVVEEEDEGGQGVAGLLGAVEGGVELHYEQVLAGTMRVPSLADFSNEAALAKAAGHVQPPLVVSGAKEQS